jgi:methylenetetrahydrofolate dehydrogenase (NADP+)/methenyltetrahydrofolate cyclohydrolase
MTEMPAIDCKFLSDKTVLELANSPRPSRFLAGVVAQEDPIGLSFQKRKKAVAETLGLDYRIYTLPGESSDDEVRKFVSRIAAHKTCGGVVVQLPLPPGINTERAINSIPPEKDPDCLSARSQNKATRSTKNILAPSVQTVLDILSSLRRDILSEKICVVGAGRLIGKPICNYLQENAAQNFTILQEGDELTAMATSNIVILGTGAQGLLKVSQLKKNAVVIDFGYGKNEQGLLRGDLFVDIERPDVFYTPTPGGTGPLLIANLLKNFYTLNS